MKDELTAVRQDPGRYLVGNQMMKGRLWEIVDPPEYRNLMRRWIVFNRGQIAQLKPVEDRID